ncbi:MAG TPA: glycoside hydrolase family 3 N-terminal domain-containing protein, partial [Pyrinomonadaceae bacterium]|nr:glycoside hydrolase family 3 N-terminal domain-containing protein [Pyrinomonadaceae bacterium]
MSPRKLTRLLLPLALVAAAAPAQPQRRHAPAPRRAESPIERRIDALLARMTLEEKLGQLQQLDGHADGRYREEHLELARKGLLGSTLNVRGVKNANELQRAAVEESRLKIPLLFGFDVIHGYRTVFPVPLGEAASFDPKTAERGA